MIAASLLALVLATLNVGSGSDAQVRSDLAELKQAADVVVVQEVTDRQDLLRWTPRWGLYQPSEGGNQAHNAIMWRRTKFALEDADSIRLTPSRWVGESGAGGAVMGANWLHHVQLRDRTTGQVVHVLGLHLMPSVQGNAATSEGRQIRRALFREAVAGVVDQVKQLQPDPVLVAGDWNAVPEFELMRPLTRGGLQLGYDPRPTHRTDRAIDLVYQQGPLEVTGQRQLQVSSDHDAVLLRYRALLAPEDDEADDPTDAADPAGQATVDRGGDVTLPRDDRSPAGRDRYWTRSPGRDRYADSPRVQDPTAPPQCGIRLPDWSPSCPSSNL